MKTYLISLFDGVSFHLQLGLFFLLRARALNYVKAREWDKLFHDYLKSKINTT
jgi:hypothetical protein